MSPKKFKSSLDLIDPRVHAYDNKNCLFKKGKYILINQKDKIVYITIYILTKINVHSQPLKLTLNFIFTCSTKESVMKLPKLHSLILQYTLIPSKNTLVVPITCFVLISTNFANSFVCLEILGSV